MYGYDLLMCHTTKASGNMINALQIDAAYTYLELTSKRCNCQSGLCSVYKQHNEKQLENIVLFSERKVTYKHDNLTNHTKTNQFSEATCVSFRN